MGKYLDSPSAWKAAAKQQGYGPGKPAVWKNGSLQPSALKKPGALVIVDDPITVEAKDPANADAAKIYAKLLNASDKSFVKVAVSFSGPYWSDYNTHSEPYTKFSERYGFTTAETAAIVQANDRGATFEQIADVIASVPIPHTTQYTPDRKKLEVELLVKLADLAGVARAQYLNSTKTFWLGPTEVQLYPMDDPPMMALVPWKYEKYALSYIVTDPLVTPIGEGMGTPHDFKPPMLLKHA